MRVADDLKKYKLSAQQVVRRLLSTQMSMINSQLRMTNKSGHIKSALRLLIAMVMQGDWAVKEVASRFDFTQYNISLLLNRKDFNVSADGRLISSVARLSYQPCQIPDKFL